MSAVRHDRSVIEAYGGEWPQIADRVRAQTIQIAAAAPNERDERVNQLRDRRRALGLTQTALGELVGSYWSVKHVESGEHDRPDEWWARIEAALAKAEAERQ